jgi:FKBP-type peptidyl-prolyl cis-trans isomerase FkpA
VIRRGALGAGLFLSALALVGCGGGNEADDAAATESASAVEEAAAPQPEFAPQLGVDLSAMRRTPSGLYIQDLEPGTGLAARSGNIVFVHYTGWLPTGEVYDSSRDGEPYSFQLGRGQVIRGWEEGMLGLPIGGKRRLVIPPELGYAGRGIPGVIPSNAWLVLDVELLDIKL